MKFKQLVDDAAEKQLKLQKLLTLLTLQNKHKYNHNFHNCKANTQNISINFFNGNKFKFCHLNWREIINAIYLRESLIELFVYPWCVLKQIVINRTVFNSLQCHSGLFRSAFNAYNLKSFLGPNITLAKIITSGFFGQFSQTIFHDLQADSSHYKPPSPKKRQHTCR